MHPVLFQWGNFFIPTYGLMIAIGLCFGTLVAVNRGKKVGIDSATVLDIVFYCALAGIVGGRIFFIILNFGMFLQDPVGVAFSRAGFVFLGSVLSAIAVGFFIANKRGIRIWDLSDAIITGVPLAHAFGRIGCFLAGCCFGCVVEEESFWHRFAVQYPPRQEIGGQEVGSWAPDAAIFPVQLLESLGNLLIFFLLMWLWRRRRFRGHIFVSYLFAYGVLRFLDEFLRADERGGLLGLSTSQILSLLGIGAGIALWKYLKRKHPVEPELEKSESKEKESGEKA